MGFFDVLKTKIAPTMDMKVCMMGPRGVGKTTILTAIFNDTKESLGSTTGLHLTAENATLSELTDREHYLNSVFAERASMSDRPSAGLAASSTVTTFDFHFGLKGKDPRINLELKDFPGEFVVDYPEDVMSFIKESTAVFIAIDTPHLMEHDGAFNDVKNKPAAITEFFKRVLPELGDERLVLLIPLKCERYFYENRMEEVADRVKESYSELIQVFKESKNIACAITPILTLGDVEYDKMLCDGEGVVKLNEFGTPERVDYRFRGDNPKYRPAFCIQPLYYLLSFLAAQYTRNRKHGDFMGRLLGSLFDNDKPLLNEIYTMEKNRKTNLPGYEVVCGHKFFQYSK